MYSFSFKTVKSIKLNVKLPDTSFDPKDSELNSFWWEWIARIIFKLMKTPAKLQRMRMKN